MTGTSQPRIDALDISNSFQFIHDRTCAWAVNSLDHAILHDDLDLIEHVIDTLKDVLSKSTQTALFSKEYISALSYALGICFSQSGRLSVLDELIALQHFGERALLTIPFLACNIAEAMLTRAEFVDVQTARALTHQALHLCQSRKKAGEVASIHPREIALLNTQLIMTSKMQYNIGATPTLPPATIINFTRKGLETVSHHPSERIGMIIAQVEALISLSSIGNTGLHALHDADTVLRSELSRPSMASSLYCIDLIAAQADVMVARLDHTRSTETHQFMKAWKTYHWAVCHPATSGRARERFKTCLRWASHALNHGFISQALTAYSCAISMLPHVVFLGEDIIGRIEALRQVNGLASSSASTALSLGRVSVALMFLEQSRGILWHQSFQIKYATLRDLPCTLRARFRSATLELEHMDDVAWTRKRHAAQELDHVLLEIRTLPTFKRFLLPPLLEEITQELCIREGFAVVIIPSGMYCDVVVIGGSDGHAHLRLETLNTARVRRLARRLTSTCATARSGSRSIFRGMKKVEVTTDFLHLRSSDDELDVLAELWQDLVRPILQHVDLLSMPPPILNSRKRLWWCPIGDLSLLPIHAAGLWRECTPKHVGNYVVSSYVPTLMALYRMFTARSNGGSSSISSPRILLLAQPHCNGLPSLPNTQIEIDRVRELVSADSLIDMPQVSVDSVLAAVGDAHVLHLACHGKQDIDNPLNSGFELTDGRLTLAKLRRARIPYAQLAYLSACESAGMDGSRPDEGLNLAGAMVFVGFKSVIATLWAMDDIDGPFMAERIYRNIIHDGMLDMSAVPYAIDDAVRELRESGVPASRWATYVHVGV